jgi:RNA polymerase sigma-70 factor (ECF subfamily)
VAVGTSGARGRLLVVARASQDARKDAEPPCDLDELTLARARRGDKQAFRLLVERYQRPVFSLLSRMLRGGRESHVEDLAQETFVRVFRGLATFGSDGRSNLGAWILTIAARLAIDELRKQPLAHESLDQLHVLGVVGGATADRESERRGVATAIERAVATLTAEQRAAFLLREVHEMDYESIAEALGVDVGTVKSRLSRARAALRRALQGTYDER